VALTIVNMFPGPHISAVYEPSANAVIVRAPEKQFPEIESLLRDLDHPPAETPKRNLLQVVHLKHAIANETREIIRRVGNPGVTCEAATGTNSLLLSGSPEDIDATLELIAVLDVPPQKHTANDSSSELQIRRYQPAHKELNALFGLLRQMGLDSFGKFAIDEQRNEILLNADEAGHRRMKEMLTLIDQPATQPRDHDTTRVRVVWLVTGMEDAAPPPNDLADVIGELERIGVKDLRLGAQSQVQAVRGQEFQINAVAELDKLFDFTYSGQVGEQTDDAIQLKFNLIITEEGSPPENPRRPGSRTVGSQVCRINTMLTAPVGHAVVLGVTPLANRTSVIIVQMLKP
jgi:hypothetical protein